VYKVGFLRYISDISNDATKNLIIDQNIKDEKEKNMVYIDILCTINGIRVIALFNSELIYL
jgi:ribosomal protein L30E